jgi:tetratricopeptide (TPR) repeat protein
VVVEILDRLVERYFLSPYITDAVFWGLYSLLPAVVLLAWTHGRPGKDSVTRAEKVGIPANLILTLGLLLTVFGNKDMSATADLVTVSNEHGVQEEYYIPRESYRRRVAIFYWDNESGDPENQWLSYGITELLTQDLQQNPFIYASSPWQDNEYGFYSQMKQAGFDDGLDVPLTLKRKMAEEAGRDYFIDGSVTYDDGEYRVTARLWQTEALEMLDEVSARDWDLLTAVDQVSIGIRDLLDTPPGRGDLPLVETYGESEKALKLYIDGLNAVTFENDFDKSNQFYDQAVATDPGFVLAWFMKARNQVEQGDATGARASLSEAQKLAYRLPERDQATVKGLIYRLSGEQDKLEKFLRMQVRVQGDATSHRNLARFLMFTGQLEEAKEQFKQLMAVDSSDIRSNLQLANLERSTGDIDAAIEYARVYQEARPEDPVGHIVIGDLLLESGDMEGARAHYEEAALLDDPPTGPVLRLALLSIRQGEWVRTRELLDEARGLSVSPGEKAAVLRVESFLEFRLGRIQRAMALTEEQVPLLRETASPVEQVYSYTAPMVDYLLMLGRFEAARELLSEGMQAIPPPINQFLGFIEVSLYAQTGEFEAAEAALEKAKLAVEHFKADYLAFQIPLASGQIAFERGDYEQAGRDFKDVLDKANRSVAAQGLEHQKSILYAACAQSHVKAGELDLAQRVLDQAFRRDDAEPRLWMARAMLQQANGTDHMALASINYALAIWAEADPDYNEYQDALALRDELVNASP